MKATHITERTLQQYLRDAQDAATRSHALWQPVNAAIAGVLEHAIHHKRSGEWILHRLLKMAGPKQSGEPVAIESYRSAARQIANGAQKLTFI